MPKASMARSGVTSPTASSMPSGAARVCSSARVWGWHRSEIRKRSLVDLPALRASSMASAAAVASSSSEALAISMPVRSATMVWKLSSASSRPWEISGW